MSAKHNEVAHLRSLYAYIIQGYTVAEYCHEPVFIRHLSPLEQAEMDEKYLMYFEEAKKAGLADEESKLQELKIVGLWSDADDHWLNEKKYTINGLRDTKKSEFLPSQIADLNRQIDAEEKEINKKLKEKSDLVGFTAETFAYQKLNEIFIYKTLFGDSALSTPFFDADEYEDLEKEEISKLITFYNEKTQAFDENTLNKIALSSFFQNYFSLCEDNLFFLYGRPIVTLTFYQLELGRAAKFFKAILNGDARPPSEVIDDPQKLIDWYMGSTNAKKIIDKTSASAGEGGGVSIVGGTDEDLKALGITEKNPLKKMAGEKGSLSMDDFLRMDGIIK